MYYYQFEVTCITSPSHTYAHPPPLLPPTHTHKDLSLDFIFGYRGFDTRQNLVYGQDGSVLYPAAGAGVVYNPLTKKQTFYLEHNDDIICLAVNRNPKLSQVVATGQSESLESGPRATGTYCTCRLQHCTARASFCAHIHSLSTASSSLDVVVSLSRSDWSYGSHPCVGLPLEEDPLYPAGSSWHWCL